MKKFLKNFAIFVVVFLIGLIIFLPKTGLWFKLEEVIFKKDVVIHGETISSNPIFLNVENGEIITSGMSVAVFESAQILPLIFFNSISITNLTVGENMQQFKELSMDNLDITYSIFQPKKIMLSGNGEFGTLKGRINFIENTIDLLIFPTDKFKKVKIIMKHFKKIENGGYVYNARF